MNSADTLNLVAGIILCGLGATILLLRWRSPTARGFGLFGLGGGITFLLQALYEPPTNLSPLALSLAGWFLLGAGLWILLFVFPIPVRRSELRLVLFSAVVGVAWILWDMIGVTLQANPDYYTVRGDVEGPAVFLAGVTVDLTNLAAVMGLFLYPLRARRFPASEAVNVRSMAIFAVGLAFFLAGNLASVANAAGDGAGLVLLVFPLALLASTLFWAWAARGQHAQICRNVALASASIYAAATVLGAFDALLVFPAGRLLGALMLGYAVLRGQIEGLDLKVRVALSKSTLAAIFIAVFFVGSETAQQFFGQRLGGPYFGIAAAGGLVFVLAPLSRMADRIAEKAVPVAAPGLAPSAATAHNHGLDVSAFRHVALRLAADGKVSAEDHRALAVLADDLRLGAVAVADILAEAERAASGAAASAVPRRRRK